MVYSTILPKAAPDEPDFSLPRLPSAKLSPEVKSTPRAPPQTPSKGVSFARASVGPESDFRAGLRLVFQNVTHTVKSRGQRGKTTDLLSSVSAFAEPFQVGAKKGVQACAPPCWPLAPCTRQCAPVHGTARR